MHPLVDKLRQDMANAADPARAGQMQAYMKTDQPFYGIQAKERRQIFRAAQKAHPVTRRQDYEAIILELWSGKYREDMYQALEVAERIKIFRDDESWPLYRQLVYSATHWDTLDWIAAKLISPLVLANRKFEAELQAWAESDNMWVRRASLLAHLRHKDRTNKKLLAETITKLAAEEEFFIRKAIGWVLRELSKTDPEWVHQFVAEHEADLSNLSKREALKHLK